MHGVHQTQVVGRENIHSSQPEHQENFRGPGADAFHRHQLSHHFLVRMSLQPLQVEPSVEDVRGEILDEGRLGPAESDRVVRFARLMGKAVQVMESEDNARKWLTSPQVGLGGAAPLDYAESEMGAREVEDLLGRIEYGVYS